MVAEVKYAYAEVHKKRGCHRKLACEDISKLSEAEKAARKARNNEISSIRIKIEHIIGQVKNFKIVAEKYRNKLKRLLLRFNLIGGIVNYENKGVI